MRNSRVCIGVAFFYLALLLYAIGTVVINGNESVNVNVNSVNVNKEATNSNERDNSEKRQENANSIDRGYTSVDKEDHKTDGVRTEHLKEEDSGYNTKKREEEKQEAFNLYEQGYKDEYVDEEDENEDTDEYEDEDEDEDEDEEGSYDNIEFSVECDDEGCKDKMKEINKLVNEKKETIRYHKKIGKPLQIVKPNVNHTELVLIEENLQVLKSIEKPIAIVSVLGDMHTGKSFLLNLLNDHIVYDLNKSKKKYINKGFKVGTDVTASTYGIWIWSEPIKVNVKKLKKMYEYLNTNFLHYIKTYEYEKDEYNEEIIDLLNLYKTDDWIKEIDKLNIPETEEVNLILMDTQGLNSPNVNKRYDEILYALTNLISTDIIFLTMKMINNKDIEFIENITKDANLFMLRAYTRSSGSTFSINKNNFDKLVDNLKYAQNNSLVLESVASKNLMWVVHDFTQRLDVRKGKLWLNILLNSDRRDLDIKYWKKLITNKSKEKYDAYTTKKKKIAYLASPGKDINGGSSNNGVEPNYKLGVLYKNIDCVLLRNMHNNKDIDFAHVNMNHMNEEYKQDMTLLRYKIYLRALLYPKMIYSNMHHGFFFKPTAEGDKFQEKSFESNETEGSTKSTSEKGSAAPATEKEENLMFHNRYMSGDDVYDFITFLVKAANQNLFTNVNQFFKQFKISRAEISRNDLIFLYKKYLLQFMENEEVELFSNLNEEDDSLENGIHLLDSYKTVMGKTKEEGVGNDAEEKEEETNAFEEGSSEESFNKKSFAEYESGGKNKSGKRMPPLIIEIQKYEELIREQILNIWNKYKDSDFHDEEEKKLIKDIEQSLHERMELIKNEMLELGENNIRKFCKVACEDALQIVVEDVKMKSEQFPIKQKDLNTFFESVSYNLLKYLEKKLSKNSEKLDLTYYTDPLCNHLINSTHQEFMFLRKKNVSLNESKLKQYFGSAVSKAKEVFEALANNTENISEYFKNKTTFYSVLDKWKLEAVNMYISSLGDFYKEEHEIGQQFLIVLENDIKNLKTKALEKWNMHCKEKTNALYNFHKSSLKQNFMENFNFPLDELVLEDIYLSLKSQEELKYTDMYCANEQSWYSEYKQFLKLSDDIYNFIKDENLRAIQVTCQQPLDDLKNEIQKEIPKYYLWHSFRKTLYNRAITVLSNNIEYIYLKNKRENKVQSMKNMENADRVSSSSEGSSVNDSTRGHVDPSSNSNSSVKNKYTKRISKELMSKVINRWLDNDIYKLYAPIIRKQCIQRIIFYFGIGILLGVTILIFYFRRFHITFVFAIITGLVMIFGWMQICTYIRLFFRRVILYSFEGTSNVFGTEGAFFFFVVFIGVISVHLYKKYFEKITQQASPLPGKILQQTKQLNMFNTANTTTKDVNVNSSRLNASYRPNLMKMPTFDKEIKHSFTPYAPYKSSFADSSFNDITNRNTQKQNADDYSNFINKNKINRSSYLT